MTPPNHDGDQSQIPWADADTRTEVEHWIEQAREHVAEAGGVLADDNVNAFAQLADMGDQDLLLAIVQATKDGWAAEGRQAKPQDRELARRWFIRLIVDLVVLKRIMKHELLIVGFNERDELILKQRVWPREAVV